MISHSEFERWVSDIGQLFDGKAYNATLVGVLHRQMRVLPWRDLDNIREALLLEHVRKPSAGAILKTAMPHVIRANEALRQKQLDDLRDQGVVCKHCDNSGRIEAKRPKDPGRTHMFACGYCDARNIHGLRSIPIWGGAIEFDGYRRVSVHDISEHAKKFVSGGPTIEKIIDGLTAQFSMDRGESEPNLSEGTLEKNIDQDCD